MKKGDSINQVAGLFGRENQSMNIMDMVFGGILNADEWQRIQLNDPQILDAEKDLNTLVEEAEKYIPENLHMELEDAHCEIARCYGNAGILFGMRVMIAIYDAVQDPVAFSRHVVERMGGRNED